VRPTPSPDFSNCQFRSIEHTGKGHHSSMKADTRASLMNWLKLRRCETPERPPDFRSFRLGPLKPLRVDCFERVDGLSC
jgi:hypothetical protein